MAILKPLPAQIGGGMTPLPMRPAAPAKPRQIGQDPAMLTTPPAMPKPVQPIRTATSPAATAASASLARPMSELRAEANGGTLPPATRGFNDPVQNKLGTMAFKNLQPRRGAGGAGTTTPSPTGDTQQSYAGLAPFMESRVGGAPRRVSGMRGARAGARYVGGGMAGKTADQAMLKSREEYAKLSPEEKAQWESKARMEDISSPVPNVGRPMMLPPPGPAQPQRPSIDPAELLPISPGITPNISPNRMPVPMMPPKKPVPSYPGGSGKYDDSMVY